MAEAYYRKTPQQALEAQKAAPAGLSGEEVRRRTGQYGPNKLSEGKQKSVSQIFFEQFKDLLVVILLIAAVISALSENVESTIVIFAVLVLNAILGTAQYVKAEKSLESLKAMSAPSAKVLRGGVRLEIPSADVVPGDIVLLEAGDMVVADGRILENFSLKVNESSLTGESEGVDKTAEAITAEQVALGDQKNMVFSGSLVTYGRATVLVTATGMETELGKIAALMNQTQQRKTPLQESLDKFSAKLATVITKAKAVNMPNDNTKRTIEKALGSGATDNYERVTYEGYGPSGVAIIVDAMTDNRNRTASDVRHYFDKYGGNMGAAGCVSWSFDKKGVIVIDNEDEDLDEEAVFESALEAGADDLEAEEGIFTVYTQPDDVASVAEALSAKYRLLSAQVEMVPQNYITLTDEGDIKNMSKMLEMFDDNEDVQNVWHNWENEE